MKLQWMCTEPDCENPKIGGLDICDSHRNALRKAERESRKPVKLNARIKKVSVPQAKIGVLLRGIYAIMDRYEIETKGYYTCEAYPSISSRTVPIDHDHTISQKRCKQLGKPELIWDKRNIVYSSRTAHKEWESYKDGKFARHKNFKERMAFLKEHDIEGWEKRMMALESLKKVRPVIVPTDHVTRGY